MLCPRHAGTGIVDRIERRHRLGRLALHQQCLAQHHIGVIGIGFRTALGQRALRGFGGLGIAAIAVIGLGQLQVELAGRGLARDGVEALEFVFGTSSEVDREEPKQLKLILLDLKLPRLDGYEVLKRIKSDPRTARIPVVMLTSSSEARDVMRNYDMGANSYVIKPVYFEQFTALIRDIGKYWLLIDRAPDREA